ncbi:hypothetical protein ROT00_07105 [Agromyces mediolanus]|uniref:hypothetical protein n=1 Tax=Agromyces mediolanus TaxID=41986 RepID=UPI0038395449
MRLDTLLTEAWRNTISGAARAVPIWVALVFITFPLLVAEGAATRAAIDEAIAYRLSGAAITTFRAADAIDGPTCDVLGSTSGVTSAGALRAVDAAVSPLALPGSTIPTFETTPAFPALLSAANTDGRAGGAFVSRAVADRLGVSAGEDLPLASGERLAVAGIYDWPDDGRRPGLGFAVVIPTIGREPFDECWATTWPESEQLAALLRSSAIPDRIDPASPPVLSAVNDTLGSEFRGDERFPARVTRLAPLAALLAAAVTLAVAVHSRRYELAHARHLGVRRADLLAIVLAELAFVLVAVALPSILAAAFLAHGPAPDRAAVFDAAIRVLAGTAVGAFTGGAGAALTTRASALASAHSAR